MSTNEIGVAEAANVLGRSEWTVYGYCKSGRLKARRIGGRGPWRIDRDDVYGKPAAPPEPPKAPEPTEP